LLNTVFDKDSPRQKTSVHKINLSRFSQQLRDGCHVVVRLNDQMHMVRHQAVTEHIQLIDLLPFLKIRQVVLKISAFDEHRLAIMTALSNMVGKPGHSHPSLSWHQRLLASDTQNPFCALAADINRSAERVCSDSNQLQAIREAAKINLSRFSVDNSASGPRGLRLQITITDSTGDDKRPEHCPIF
jgi:hypothetical protein